MRIIEEVKLDYDDVLLLPKRSSTKSRAHVDLSRVYRFKWNPVGHYFGVPVIVANMDHTGTIAMAKAVSPFGLSVALHKFITWPVTVEGLNIWHTTGIDDSFYPRSEFICVDVANGYSPQLVRFVAELRDTFRTHVIMAGNVVTPDMTYDLLNAGADIVKIGIGAGRACTTRRVTGVGYPQLSAVMECADAAHGIGGYICADGGITSSGDIAKSFAAGADFVMAGAIFAGHDECEGQFRGMSSREAMEDHYGEKASYRAAEGEVIQIENKGSVTETCEEILGGLRSACSYVGATKLADLKECATFVRVNRQK